MFHGCFKEVLRKLQECFKCVENDVLKVFTARFKVIAGKSQECIPKLCPEKQREPKDNFQDVSG